MNTILIVEDDNNIRDILQMTLEQAGYVCVLAPDGEVAADLLDEAVFDLILLDIMLPHVDGYELLEYIEDTPVIFITAKGSLADRVKGLRLGADDYIVKPFEPAEVLARVEALLRRVGKGTTLLTAFDTTVDLVARTVEQNGAPVYLTLHEFDLLVLLMRNRGAAFYRSVLFERVWGGELEDGNRTLDIHIMRLRQKLHWEERIKTVFKIGYMLEK